jgi:serine/threonine protein kinase
MTSTDSSRLLKDIKGDNVLVSTTERNGLTEFVVKLIDFGCAKKPGVDDDGVAREMTYSLVFCFLQSLKICHIELCYADMHVDEEITKEHVLDLHNSKVYQGVANQFAPEVKRWTFMCCLRMCRTAVFRSYSL